MSVRWTLVDLSFSQHMLCRTNDSIDALTFLHQLDPPVCPGDIKSVSLNVDRPSIYAYPESQTFLSTQNAEMFYATLI